ncbi:MAG: dUTP diphosphatase [Promethearchaeota archaeon]|nr:MAG: dUTP diphosphatase [Candidatus Lokiarchaeota archaeon]TFG22673.1 MAG: dUTP diphosphatase [Candidatus Lokiarchaeota archaeon]
MPQQTKNKLLIPLKPLTEGLIIPKPSQPGDAGADARIMGFKKIINEDGKRDLIKLDVDSYTLKPLERIGCPLGFATAIPEGYYFKVAPRSGLALWEGISIVNSPGTIDTGYRNEWMAIVVNLSNKEVTLKKGERICQIILSKMYDYEFVETDTLPDSDRGLGGFGSTGKG